MGERDGRQYEESRVQHIEIQRLELRKRGKGCLGKAFRRPLLNNPTEVLRQRLLENQHKAEEGLMELRSGNEVSYKHIDDLTREDPLAKIQVEIAWTAQLIERLGRNTSGSDAK